MKIAVFYRDAYSNGGVPSEIAALVRTMSEENTVHYWGRGNKQNKELLQDIACHSYSNLLDLYRTFAGWLSREAPDVVIAVGFFMPDNLIVSLACKKNGVPVVLNPLAQIMDEIYKGKIFTKYPDVRSLERSTSNSSDWPGKLFVLLNPLLKRVYLKTVGSMIVAKSDAVAVFSDYEAAQFSGYFPGAQVSILPLKWGIGSMGEEPEGRHFFKDILGFGDDKANFVYWGRLDWHYKGIDRLLAGVNHLVKNKAAVPFRLFLIGPDYHAGAGKIAAFIKEHGLQDIVFPMLPGSYPAGSKTPLRDASASICLSRWDGFPRTLRESVLLSVPVIVSRETHFGELVSAFGNGIAISDADNTEEVGNALLNACNQESQLRYRSASYRLAPYLSWAAVAGDFTASLKSRFSQPMNHKVSK